MSSNNNATSSVTSSALTSSSGKPGGASIVNKALIPNANDLQSKLAKLQQNIAQKLNKTNVPPPISATKSTTPPTLPVASITPPTTISNNNNTTVVQSSNTANPTVSTSSSLPSSVTSTAIPSSTTKAKTNLIPPPQLSKIQKPNTTKPPVNGLGKQVASQIQKSLKNTPTPVTNIKPKTSNTIKSSSTTTSSTNVINSNAVLNNQVDDDNSMEKQIYMMDYQRKKETSQIQQQYQQELLQHEQAQQELENSNKKKKKNLRTVFTASGKSEVWEDSRLDEFAENDFRIYANNLGNEVTDQMLTNFFSHYTSFSKACVIRDKRTNRAKGYGFISFLDSNDYIHALENLNGKYLGNRPLQLKPSKWKDRNIK